MRRLAVMWFVLAVPTAAFARQIGDPTDGTFAGHVVATFDTVTPAAPTTMLTDMTTMFTVTATTLPASITMYGTCGDPATGCLFSWSQETSPDAPVTLTFDRPLTAVGITRGATGCYAPLTIVRVTGDQGVENVTAPCSEGTTLFLGADSIGVISKVELIGSATWDNLIMVNGSAVITPDSTIVTESHHCNGCRSTPRAGDAAPWIIGFGLLFRRRRRHKPMR